MDRKTVCKREPCKDEARDAKITAMKYAIEISGDSKSTREGTGNKDVSIQQRVQRA